MPRQRVPQVRRGPEANLAAFDTPDYVPIFGFPGAAGVSRSYWTSIRRRLVATGMPSHVGSLAIDGENREDEESWNRYWGTTGPIESPIKLARDARGFEEKRRVEGGFEVVESESGAITRQVIDNDNAYSMPQFVAYPVRDRDSWELYRDRMTPPSIRSMLDFQDASEHCAQRTSPLVLRIRGAFFLLRDLMGTEKLSLAFYDDTELIHDMLAWHLGQVRKAIFPVIEALSPEIVVLHEDLCYNHGLLVSPELVGKICSPLYREVSTVAQASGVDLVAVDTDGNVMDFAPIATADGIRCLYPFETKAGNDLFKLRERHPDLVLGGWVEKEVINEGNGERIEDEILGKVPRLLEKGGYFPNADHSLQPLATFQNLCRFMTVLHEVCGNPEGEFPRTWP